MKPEEAIDRITYIAEALEMAVEALEKQIPKKVGISNGFMKYYCPTCGKQPLSGKRCSECGQVIDWAEDEG